MQTTPPGRRYRVAVHVSGEQPFDIAYPRDLVSTPPLSPIRPKVVAKFPYLSQQDLVLIATPKERGSSYRVLVSQDPVALALNKRLQELEPVHQMRRDDEDGQPPVGGGDEPITLESLSRTILSDRQAQREVNRRLEDSNRTLEDSNRKLHATLADQERRRVLEKRAVTLLGMLNYSLEDLDPDSVVERPPRSGRWDHKSKQMLFDLVRTRSGKVEMKRAESPMFCRTVTLQAIERINDSFAASDRHDTAHPERSVTRLLSDALELYRFDRRSHGVDDAVKMLLAVLGRTRFLDVVEILRADAGYEYAPVDEGQIQALLRLWW